LHFLDAHGLSGEDLADVNLPSRQQANLILAHGGMVSYV
jgi:hypothetical protein